MLNILLKTVVTFVDVINSINKKSNNISINLIKIHVKSLKIDIHGVANLMKENNELKKARQSSSS